MYAYAEDGFDSLQEAAKTGDIATIRRLVAGGLDVNAAKERDSPLLTATNWNRYEAVQTLIALGADVNYKVGQWTPLMRAVGRDTRIVKALIDAGADVNYVDPFLGKSPLSYVAQNSPGIFEQLRKKGVYSGPFPDSVETTRLLIEAGADVNHREKNGLTVLRIAVSSCNTEIVRLLLKRGTDVNGHNPTTSDSRTYTYTDDPILLDAVAGYPGISADIVANLLDAGADPNYREPRPYDASFDSSGKTTDGYTALTFAARWGYLPIVELLLRHGADPCLARADGALAATIAEEQKFSRIANAIGQHANGACKAPN
jgi:ankyrin repeat protein